MSYRSFNSLRLLVCCIVFLFAFTACGGGTVTFSPNPNPNPPAAGTQKAPTPDAAKIYSGPAMFVPAYCVEGTAGAAEPNAQMIYEDSNGLTTQGPAGADGSFYIDTFPSGWNQNAGAQVHVRQEIPGHTPSDPATVTNAP